MEVGPRQGRMQDFRKGERQLIRSPRKMAGGGGSSLGPTSWAKKGGGGPRAYGPHESWDCTKCGCKKKGKLKCGKEQRMFNTAIIQ